MSMVEVEVDGVQSTSTCREGGPGLSEGEGERAPDGVEVESEAVRGRVFAGCRGGEGGGRYGGAYRVRGSSQGLAGSIKRVLEGGRAEEGRRGLTSMRTAGGSASRQTGQASSWVPSTAVQE